MSELPSLRRTAANNATSDRRAESTSGREARYRREDKIFYRSLVLIVFIVFSIVLVLWMSLGVRNAKEHRHSIRLKTYEEIGVYGDSFGYVNSLFSGFAFGGVLVAIVLQALALRLQKRELEETKTALEDSADSQAELVRLNALATLTQSLYEDIKMNASNHKNDFNHYLETDMEKIKGTTYYKWLMSRHLLEVMYAKAANEPLGMIRPIDLAYEQRLHWCKHFSSVRLLVDAFVERMQVSRLISSTLPEVAILTIFNIQNMSSLAQFAYCIDDENGNLKSCLDSIIRISLKYHRILNEAMISKKEVLMDTEDLEILIQSSSRMVHIAFGQATFYQHQSEIDWTNAF